jgi:hypothetical protein
MRRDESGNGRWLRLGRQLFNDSAPPARDRRRPERMPHLVHRWHRPSLLKLLMSLTHRGVSDIRRHGNHDQNEVGMT